MRIPIKCTDWLIMDLWVTLEIIQPHFGPAHHWTLRQIGCPIINGLYEHSPLSTLFWTRQLFEIRFLRVRSAYCPVKVRDWSESESENDAKEWCHFVGIFFCFKFVNQLQVGSSVEVDCMRQPQACQNIQHFIRYVYLASLHPWNTIHPVPETLPGL
jgi:hypothetical protein